MCTVLVCLQTLTLNSYYMEQCTGVVTGFLNREQVALGLLKRISHLGGVCMGPYLPPLPPVNKHLCFLDTFLNFDKG